MRLLRFGAGALLFALSACGGTKSNTSDEPKAAAPGKAAGSAPTTAAAPQYNLGDVDFATVVTIQLSDRSKNPAIQVKETKTALRGTIAIANVTVPKPPPKELWVITRIESQLGYQIRDAVLVRMSITTDNRKEPVLKKSYVFAGKGLMNSPEMTELDLMPFLDPLPDSVLVQARLEIVWFPATDPKTINPDSVDISKGQRIEKLSNPLRIDFK